MAALLLSCQRTRVWTVGRSSCCWTWLTCARPNGSPDRRKPLMVPRLSVKFIVKPNNKSESNGCKLTARSPRAEKKSALSENKRYRKVDGRLLVATLLPLRARVDEVPPPLAVAAEVVTLVVAEVPRRVAVARTSRLVAEISLNLRTALLDTCQRISPQLARSPQTRVVPTCSTFCPLRMTHPVPQPRLTSLAKARTSLSAMSKSLLPWRL
jgi:hypothetical protein